MADDKEGRENQAQNEDRRQRERAMATALERLDEPEPQADADDLAVIESAVSSLDFPATGADVVAVAGDERLTDHDGTHEVADLVPESEMDTFESTADVLRRIERSTVAGAMKRVVTAGEDRPHADLSGSQRDAYEKTFRALAAIDAVDTDEGVAVIADWILDRLDETGSYPGSRAVRREAAKFCRGEGYTVRSDEWLGV